MATTLIAPNCPSPIMRKPQPMTVHTGSLEHLRSVWLTSNDCGGSIMAIELHNDFKEFLRLLNAADVRYLIVGGYAVAHHGYPAPRRTWACGLKRVPRTWRHFSMR